MEKKLNLSVHQLVDFLLRTGDIDNRIFNKSTMAEGTRIHSFYQNKQGRNYLSEYYLKETFEVDGFEVTIDGRADGIIVYSNDDYVVDEIKSTIVQLNEYFEEHKRWHLGQAKCYALMIAHEKNLDHVGVQLTYIHQLFDEKMTRTFSFSVQELEEDIKNLIHEYLEFYQFIFNRTVERNESAAKLDFPFPSFRSGQRQLAKYCYGIANKGGVLFVEAPTGIGKTMSTLYPFAKSFAKEENDKIFYLTAKSSGKEAAYEATKLLAKKGFKGSAIVLTAKDKICYCPGKACNPDECPYAKGYYTKIREVLNEAVRKYQIFSLSEVLKIASKHLICPFELSLDLSLFVDIIICDYNYFFDPQVYLRRYFDEVRNNTLVLVDEAHNLVERGRSMYSASISSALYKKAKKAVKNLEHSKIHNAEKRISKIFNLYKDFPDGETIIDGLSQTNLNAISAYLLAATDVSKHHHGFVTDEFMDFFFELNKFSKLMDFYDETFSLFVSKKGKKDTILTLYCLDPSTHLRATLNRVKSAVIFSATFSPIEYYMNAIGRYDNAPLLKLPSPFPKENLRLLIAPNISIRYKNRLATLKQVGEYINTMIKGKVGNYFVYVPSYEYLQSLLPYLQNEDYRLIVQEKDMDEISKEGFLSMFEENPKETTVGLCVVGGAFGEGIDLVSDRLIGVVVVGVGLPQICFERDLIKEHFAKGEDNGFEYAYVNPGMNRVAQAVGRVIRSESDKGIVLLIDDRFLSQTYRDLFKNEWNHYEVVTSKEDIEAQVKDFWFINK